MDYVLVATVPVIGAIVYLVVEGIKKFFSSEKLELFKKYIPIVSGVLGGIIGIIAFVSMPTILPENINLLDAIVIGCASGLGATGTNQIFKQLTK